MVGVRSKLPDCVTADLVEIAIAAAAASYGDDASLAKTSANSAHRRSLAAAVLGLVDATAAPKLRVAELVGVHNSSPGLNARGATSAALDARAAAREACRAHLDATGAERTLTRSLPINRPAQTGRLSPEDRALIDAAIAAGRVTVLPPAAASGLTTVEQRLWAAPPLRQADLVSSKRGGQAMAMRFAMGRTA